MLLAQQYLSAKNYAMDLITRFYKNAKDTHDNSYSIGFNFKVNVKVYIRHRIAQKKNSMYPFYTHAAPAVHHHTKKKHSIMAYAHNTGKSFDQCCKNSRNQRSV